MIITPNIYERTAPSISPNENLILIYTTNKSKLVEAKLATTYVNQGR